MFMVMNDTNNTFVLATFEFFLYGNRVVIDIERVYILLLIPLSY